LETCSWPAYPIAVTERSSTFLTAEWRYLAMLNYEVDPNLLSALVPAGTELDTWNGKTFISLVGFRFLRTRVLGIAFLFHRNFSEINLRFYVRRRHGDEVRRGVVFVREIVPRRAIAVIARFFYGERYVALPMMHRVYSDGDAPLVEYGWKSKGRSNGLRVRAGGRPQLPQPSSQEEFITEHYWGYSSNGENSVEYEVQHPQWKVWSAAEASFDGCAEELYGRELNAALKGTPSSAFLAEGSEVTVYRGVKFTAHTR
jgi:uncharacterized protein